MASCCLYCFYSRHSLALTVFNKNHCVAIAILSLTGPNGDDARGLDLSLLETKTGAFLPHDVRNDFRQLFVYR